MLRMCWDPPVRSFKNCQLHFLCVYSRESAAAMTYTQTKPDSMLPRYYVASCTVNFEWLRSYRQLCSGLLEARHAQNSTAPVTRMHQKLCHPVKGLMQCRAARARGYAEWGCCYWGRGLKVQRSKRMRSIWRRWATRYIQWRGCCGGPWKPSRDANISKSFGIGSRFNNLFFRLQIWINHISICIVIHLCFGIDSTTFAINMVPSGPAPVPVVVEGLLFFPCAESCLQLQIPVKLQKSSL